MDNIFNSNNNVFKSANDIKDLTDKYYINFPKKLKEDLLESIPSYIERHAIRGEYFVPYYTSSFSMFSSTFYIEVFKEVGKMLKDNGYYVEIVLLDAENDYNKILFIISWDIKKVRENYTANKHYLSLIRNGISIDID